MATPLFRGVLAQVLRASLEWIALDGEDVLVCEREEDFDKLVRTGDRVDLVAHQIKDLTDKISARDEEIREAIANFAIAFEHYDRLGIRSQFVFTTTAAAVIQRVDSSVTVDVLNHWRAYAESDADHRDPRLVNSIKALEEYRKVGTERGQRRYDQVASAHAYLDANRWDSFLRAVTWRFCAESFTAVRQHLVDALTRDERFAEFSPDIIVARLVGEVLQRSAKDELRDRVLRKQDLEELSRETAEQHRVWAQQRPFALWFAGIENSLSDVQERLSRVEAKVELNAEDPWPKYSEWLRARVDYLSLLGLPGVSLPIASTMPIRLQPAEVNSVAFDGRYLHLREEKHVLVTGQPGSGKSGLSRVIAGTAISAGLKVVRGRLKVVATELRRGVPVADALAASLAEGFLSLSATRRLLAEADLLLFDGLDEATTSRGLIIEHLESWSGHGKLIVTSRKEGDAKLLDGFAHFQLRRIEPSDAGVLARRVAELQEVQGLAAVEQVSEVFSSHPELATPLLVGFVLAVAFASRANQVPTSPARLYDRTLRLVAGAVRGDRTFDVQLDADLAIDVLSSLAWLQMERPAADLVEIKVALRAQHGANGARAIDFWEERGLLEIRTSALRDDIEFSHESLWEFALARYLCGLPEDQVERLVSVHCDDPGWSQILRFAIQLGHAPAIIRAVLARSEAHRTLRAAQLAALIPERISTQLLDRLLEGFSSGIPTLVCRASSLVADFVKDDRVDVAAVSQRFPSHTHYETAWDRLGALTIRIALVERSIQDGDIAAWLIEEADQHRAHGHAFGQRALHWWPTFQDLIPRAVAAVHNTSGSDAAISLLNEFEHRRLLTMHSLDEVEDWARRAAAGPLRQAAYSIRLVHAKHFADAGRSQPGIPFEDFEEQVLEGLYLVFSEACPETESADHDGGVGFAVTLESIGYMKLPSTEGAFFRMPNGRRLLAPILRQWVVALRLDPAAVGNFARAMLARRPFQLSMLEWPHPPSRTPHWDVEKFRASGIQLEALLSMLNVGSHNSLLKNLLGPLLLAWRPSSELVDLIDSKAAQFKGETWEWLVRNAPEVWHDRAESKAEELISKFNGPGTVWLLALVAKELTPQLRQRLRDALASTDVVAERAARVNDARFAAWKLGQQIDDEVLADAWGALRDWTQRPVMDNPRSMPDSPLELLAETILTLDSSDAVVRELADHPDGGVREQVVKLLRDQPFDGERWDLLLPTRALVQMLVALKNNISQAELTWMLKRTESTEERTRRLVAEALLGAPSLEDVTVSLERLCADQSPQVRDKAFDVLRIRTGGRVADT